MKGALDAYNHTYTGPLLADADHTSAKVKCVCVCNGILGMGIGSVLTGAKLRGVQSVWQVWVVNYQKKICFHYGLSAFSCSAPILGFRTAVA